MENCKTSIFELDFEILLKHSNRINRLNEYQKSLIAPEILEQIKLIK